MLSKFDLLSVSLFPSLIYSSEISLHVFAHTPRLAGTGYREKSLSTYSRVFCSRYQKVYLATEARKWF